MVLSTPIIFPLCGVTPCPQREFDRAAFAVFARPPSCPRSQKISFEASEMAEGTVIEVDVDLVKERVSDMLEGSDLSKYII